MLAWHRQQGRLGRALMTWIHHCNVLPGGNILKIGCGRRKPPTCGNTFPRFLHFDSEVLVSDPAPSMRCRQKCRREKKKKRSTIACVTVAMTKPSSPIHPSSHLGLSSRAFPTYRSLNSRVCHECACPIMPCAHPFSCTSRIPRQHSRDPPVRRLICNMHRYFPMLFEGTVLRKFTLHVAVRVLRLCHSNDAEYHATARAITMQNIMPRRVHQAFCKNNLKFVQVTHLDCCMASQQEGNGCNDPVKESNPTCETNLLVTHNLFVTGFVYRNVDVQMRKNVLKLLMQSSYTEATVACIVVLPLLLPRDFAKKIDHLNFHLFGPRVEFSLGKFKCEWFHGYPPTS